MNILLVIWRATVRSSSNAFRQDGRRRVSGLSALLLQVGSGIWGCTRLFSAFISWQSADTLPIHLWLTCLASWSILSLFSLIALFQEGLNSNEATLLALQPIEPATRLRALYGLIVLKAGNWLVWEAGMFGVALIWVLGWSALAWLAMLIIGAALVAWLTLIATLLILRFIVPHLRVMLGSFVALSALLWVSILALRGTGWDFSPVTAPVFSWFAAELILPEHVGSFALPSLALLLPGMFLLLLLVLLPLAHRSGLLYLSVLLRLQAGTNTSSTLSLPGTRLLTGWLIHSRTMTAALLFKGLLNQSRHLLAWIRLLVLFILLVLFAPISAALGSLHLTPLVLVAGYATLVAALMLLEYAPYALSGEGDRLALYLLIPRGISSFLRARLCSFLLPALLIGLAVTLLLSLWIHLSLLDLGSALLLVLLSLSGYTAFAVLGSALDEDLSLAVEDGIQALIQEELPVTPRRLQLLSLSVALLVMLLLLDWKLPVLLALPVLALLDIAIVGLMWRLSTIYLARLLR